MKSLLVFDSRKNEIGEVEYYENTTVKELKTTIVKQLLKRNLPISQVYIKSDDIVLNDNQRLVKTYNLSNKQKIYFKNIGKQVGYDTVFYIEYSGPLLVQLILLLTKKDKLDLIQKSGLLMGAFHYIKRLLETKFVHIFSNETMPFKRIFINSAHYWVLYGSSVYEMLYHNKQQYSNNQPYKLFLAGFLICEFMNYSCHNVLRKIRTKKQGGDQSLNKQRDVPSGYGFNQVSCANYFWEIGSWIFYSLFTKSYSSYLFLIVSTFQMTDWALKKQRRYKKDFGSNFPKGRKAIFPYIL